MLFRALLQSLDLFPETGESGAESEVLLAMSYGTDLPGLYAHTHKPDCTTQMLDYHLYRLTSRGIAVTPVRLQANYQVAAGEGHDTVVHAHPCWQRTPPLQVLSGCAPGTPSASQFGGLIENGARRAACCYLLVLRGILLPDLP